MKQLNFENLAIPKPVTSYEAAVSGVETLQGRDSDKINPLCRTTLLTHGRKTGEVIVYLHGFTNCPNQFQQLGARFFELGYNVLVPRMPLHGIADRLTKDLARLTAEELVTFTSEVLNIARGLGERVTIIGLSLGGTMAAWAAQQRPDLDRAVLIAPLISLKLIPRFMEKSVVSLAMNLPNVFLWWDPREGAGLEPAHAYPRHCTHALGESMRLAYRVKADAAQHPPKAKEVLVITNAADLAVDNSVMAEVVDDWRKNGAENIETYQFEGSLNLHHDCIDPGQATQKVDQVYPVLLNLIAGEKTS
jgi:pimeloyl-ACP methyl ester carboxylesterase